MSESFAPFLASRLWSTFSRTLRTMEKLCCIMTAFPYSANTVSSETTTAAPDFPSAARYSPVRMSPPASTTTS